MSCKKKDNKKKLFKTVWHNEIRDITAKLLSQVCKDVGEERSLVKLIGEEEPMRRTAKKTKLD